MIALFGDSAYYEGSSRALAAERRQPRDPYWAKVRREIAPARAPLPRRYHHALS
jgi:hypothetical protein